MSFQIRVDYEKEDSLYEIQQLVKGKLSGTNLNPPMCKASLLMTLAQAMDELRQELINRSAAGKYNPSVPVKS